jgi:hypothetical protein
MKFREPTKLHRKSGIWGTRRLVRGQSPKIALIPPLNLVAGLENLRENWILFQGTTLRAAEKLCFVSGHDLVGP